MQPDQQLQSPQEQRESGAADVTAAQGPQRATSYSDRGEDLRTQSSVLFPFQTLFIRMILFTVLMAGVLKSKADFEGFWGG